MAFAAVISTLAVFIVIAMICVLILRWVLRVDTIVDLLTEIRNNLEADVEYVEVEENE